MVELYLVRHGETDTNNQGKINGSATNLSLNETGRQQVNYLKDHLNINNFDEVYASPLKRALETAEILNQDTHQIQLDKRLMEINFGSWDGLAADKLMEEHPDAFDENHYLNENYSKYATNSESYDDVCHRLQDFINDVASKGNEKILVVCHGFVIRSFVKIATETPDIKNILAPENAGVTKIKVQSDGNSFLGFFDRLENIN